VHSALDYVRQLLKKLVADLIALVTKKWVLQIGASMLSGTAAGSALATEAGTLGNGSFAGSILNGGLSTITGGSSLWGSISSYGALGSYASTASAYGAAGAGAEAAVGFGTEAAATYGGIGSTISTAIAAVPVWGWIVAAIGAVAYAIRDKGENWKAQVGFGSPAQAYATNGVFGPEGFHNIAGDDRLNSALQAFMASTHSLDTGLATHLSATQMDPIRTNLQSQNAREFAFPRGDDTAAEQLTLDYLQRKYGTIFDQIDTKFAAFIRGYTGKSEDLVTQITQFATLLDQIDQSGLKGLNITSLRAIAGEGGDLGATLTALAQGFAQLRDSFTSDAEKMAGAQGLVSQTFKDLGIAVPDSMEAFRNLIDSIDFSTDSGVQLYNALNRVAPAFIAVQNAAQQMLDTFHSSLATLFGGTYTSGQKTSQILAQIDALRQMVPAIAALASASDILTVLANVDAASLQQVYDELASNPAAQALYAQIIALYAAMHQATTTTGTVATGITDLSGGLSNLASQLDAARASVAAYLKSLLLNTQLTPLSPMDQLAVAQSQYQQTLTAAQGGNVDAINGLGASADTYLKLARQIFASSSAYNAIFQQVYNQLAGVAGPGTPTLDSALQAALPAGGAKLASSADIADVKYLLNAILTNGIVVRDTSVPAQTAAIVNQIRKQTPVPLP